MAVERPGDGSGKVRERQLEGREKALVSPRFAVEPCQFR